jgi:hypothetical protein
MAAHISHIRRIYSRPWREGTLANPGQISTCVQVGVRPETTLLAHETMSEPFSQPTAGRTRAAGVGRVNVLDRHACHPRLVLDKALQLAERPAMQPAAQPLARADALADVRQIFHPDLRDARPERFLYDRLARFVIDVPHAPPLLAGDLPELLPGALAAVGLETRTQSKVSIAPMAQALPAPDLARTGGGEGVFSDIHAHHETRGACWRVNGFHHEVKEPLPIPKNQLGFLRSAGLQNGSLVLGGDPGDRDTSLQGVQRNAMRFDRVGALVIVNARPIEAKHRHRFVPPDPAVAVRDHIDRTSHGSLYIYTVQVQNVIPPATEAGFLARSL